MSAREPIPTNAPDLLAALVRHAYGFRIAALAKRGIGPMADGTFVPASEDTVAAHVYDYMAARERQVVADLSVHTLLAEVKRLRAELDAAEKRGRNEIIDRCAKRFPNSTFWREWRKP